MAVPHEVRSESIWVSGPTPQMRGMSRAAQTAQRIRSAHRRYTHLYDTLGIDDAAVKSAAKDSLAALRDWDADQHQEITGVAMGAGMTPADLMAVIARTEILALADRTALPTQTDGPQKASTDDASGQGTAGSASSDSPAPASECSTIAFWADSDAPTVGAQTWDWYPEFADAWHLHAVSALPGTHGYSGVAEYGMTGKIGLNSAGVGCFLNILFSADDAAGGVPVHAVLAGILGRAGSVDEAVEIIRSAQMTSSSVITLLDEQRAVMVEISAGDVRVIEGPGFAVHTNHFIHDDFGPTGLLSPPDSNTFDRLDFIKQTTGAAGVPDTAEDLVPLLCSDPAADSVAKLPGDDAMESATLATVRIDPAARRVAVSPGIPQYAPVRTVVMHTDMLGDRTADAPTREDMS